ncbi:MAG: TetR/AcrR family transcriptional regulator [Actinoallomurus sp.]
MPRIAAGTVAEHRARQHGLLLAAAREIMLSDGPQAVTPAAVGARAGLARSSVYKYFSSTGDIYAQLIEEAFARWTERVREACAGETDPAAKIAAYVHASLTLAAAGEHRLLAGALAGVELPTECTARIQDLHAELDEPLRAAVAEQGDPAPDITTALLRGIIEGGIQLIEAGRPYTEVGPAVDAFIRGPRSAPPAGPRRTAP